MVGGGGRGQWAGPEFKRDICSMLITVLHDRIHLGCSVGCSSEEARDHSRPCEESLECVDQTSEDIAPESGY